MKIKTTLLCLATSLLLVLSFPRFDFYYLAWVGFIPLFFAIGEATKRQAFWYSYLAGFVFFISVLYWLVHVTLAGLIILSLYLSFYFAFFGYFFTGFKRRVPGSNILTIIFLSSIWVVLEFIRCHLMTGFPWVLLGYSQYLNSGLMQIADITGSPGISFLIIFVNLYLFYSVKLILAKDFRPLIKILFILLLVFAAVYGYGTYALNKYSSEGEAALKVSLIQGNIPQEDKWASIFRDRIKQTYFDLTRECTADDPDLIIWPETAYPDYFTREGMPIFRPLLELARDVQKPILFGAVLEEEGKYFNTAALIPSDLLQVIFYKKIHLVPFGEYLPLRKYLPFLEKFVPIEDFDPGKELVVFNIKNKEREIVSFSVLICFEDTLSDLARQFRVKGADFLVNITNDAWFKQTASPYQHMQASVFRAVENRVYVLRAANTGITCVIDTCGRVIKKAQDDKGRDIFVRGFISSTIKKQDELSIYSRFGDVFVLVCGLYIVWFALFLANKLSRRMKKYYISKF